MRMTTATRKLIAHPMAVNRRRFFSMIKRDEYSDEYRTSDVIKSIIVVIASHRLMSDKFRGNVIPISLHDLVEDLYF
jgi:hypothetical protein